MKDLDARYDIKRLIEAIQITFGPENEHLENIMDLVTREEKPENFGMSLSGSIQPTWD